METKQVIIVRSDLRNTKGEKIRTGKLIAQGAHASLKAILDSSWGTKNELAEIMGITLMPGSALENWIKGLFTKICLSVDSEQELLDIYNKAKEKNMICSLIQDAGLTEFGGVPTYTCCAIGPDFNEKIDEITKHLKLL